jgi:predicted GNAT family N-acyltransferase
MGIIQEITFGTPEYDESVALRNKILRLPLGLEFDPKVLANEYLDYHLGYYDNNYRLVACLILSNLGEAVVKMRQVAVDERAQGKGIGSKLVLKSEEISQDNNATELMCHARKTAVPFYLKLGYNTIGDEFSEVNIPHFKMSKSLMKSAKN